MFKVVLKLLFVYYTFVHKCNSFPKNFIHYEKLFFYTRTTILKL